MALSDASIRNAKAGPKPVKLSDGGGLFLLLNPNGSRLWRLKYRFAGKEKLMAFGAYPDVSLKDARESRDDARRQLAAGHDPGEARKASKAAATARACNSFEVIAREWFELTKAKWESEYANLVLRRLESDIFPLLGGRPIAEITPLELLTVLRRIEQRGANDLTRRVLQKCGQVFRYAVVTGRAPRDPTTDLRDALKPVQKQHYASIQDPKAVGELMRAMRDYLGAFETKCALLLGILTFVRPGELRKAEWLEFDREQAEWRIPASRMKMKEQHIVPLSTQALAVLNDLHVATGHGRYLFPSIRTSSRPMSENTVNAALRRLGYTREEMTGHGFRSTASTLLNELGWPSDAIERQLSHGERDEVRSAYNFAEYLPVRRTMMQAWADHLDTLERGARIVRTQFPKAS
ncbi:tyrosine-type recombinase/integrase [Burkholderia sp. PAMC 26561]|uniref:tyrosine-type recombinase/integrase n=1 Tax=Burkholderia sp. PAMC 26561 TaxID=1795043 RepID=UPI00076AF8EA|nr:integrase arm-type DNA-binding domain-containing protein [Burkholderia sp. PAMC 26561]AME26253.1 integrase [Burkholderia sp. PAMC 26561]